MRGLVVLTRAALDLFFLGKEALELGVGFLHERARLFGGLLVLGRGFGGDAPAATGQLESPGRLRAVRKDIARIYTVMRERELGITTEPDGAA